jgi:restriction endonuclease S subunit
VDQEKYQNSKKFVQKDDILIQSVAHTKEYIADKMAILDDIPRGIKKILALSKFIIARPDPSKVDPVYLFVYLSSKLGREQFKHFIRGMTAEIYEFDIRNILVVLPSPMKQKKIARKYLENIKKYFVLDNEVATIKNALDTVEQDLL